MPLKIAGPTPETAPSSSRHISPIRRSIFMGSCYFHAICLLGFSPDLARCTRFSSRGHGYSYGLSRKTSYTAQSLADNSKYR
jgi:hypothetical protein